MSGQKTDIDTPVQGYNGGKSPSAEELKMPVKSYPDSGKMGKEGGKEVTISGPCEGKNYGHGKRYKR